MTHYLLSVYVGKDDPQPAEDTLQEMYAAVDVFTKEPKEITQVDALILVNGATAQNRLFQELRSARKDLEVHLIGDALAPRRINDAIFEAELVARKI